MEIKKCCEPYTDDLDNALDWLDMVHIKRDFYLHLEQDHVNVHCKVCTMVLSKDELKHHTDKECLSYMDMMNKYYNIIGG